jgi:predicted amidohydrolase YtcJ
MIHRIALASIIASSVLWLSCSREQPDLIVHHGKIVTVDPEFRIAEAMAVKGDRILAVGSNSEIEALAGGQTQQIDLEGKTVLPGLIDSHTHPVGAAMYEFDHPVPDMETIDDVLKYIKSRADALGPGKWINLSQVFITRLKDQRYPTRQELDRVAPKNPVVFSTGPDASLNSLALKLSGIDKNFKVPEGHRCRVERDAKTGAPTGILRSCSEFIKDESSEKKPTEEDYINRMKMLLADYNSVGLTGIVDGDTSDHEVEIYKTLKDRGDLTCRTFLTLHVSSTMPMDKIEARIRNAAANPLHKYDNLLWLRGIKTYLDGGMLTGSAYMLKPWGVSKVYSITDPEYRGMLYIQPDKLYQMAKLALENDLQFTAHAVGDGAVHNMVSAYERINKNDFPVRDKRPNITHANFMTAEDINTMKEIGVVANLQPDWLYLDGATLLKQFGNDRLAYFQPYKTLFDEGVNVGGGSDHMQKIGSFRSINQYNPFLGMWITLTRQPRWMDGPLHPEQRITREQAIRLYTINNAYMTFEEKEKGSLEKGKLADFIVLDKDILTCPVDEVKNIQVEASSSISVRRAEQHSTGYLPSRLRSSWESRHRLRTADCRER